MSHQKTEAIGRSGMRIRLHLKVMTCCVGAALAQLGAEQAFADSGVGVDTALGNALNPPGRSAMPRPLDSDAFDSVRHSPTGQLYGVPYDVSEEPTKTDSGWEYSGGVEVGALGGDAGKKNALFRQYRDLKNGPYLNYFQVEAEKPVDAHYIQSFGGGTGQHDQFYGFQFGRYNDWKMKLFYNETIHVFTNNWKSLYSGEGTGNLTTGLPAPSAVTSGTVTSQSAALGLTPFGTGASSCTATLPCWAYNGKLYSNASALNAINGVAGTYGGAAGTTLTAGSPQSGMAAAIANKLATAGDSELSLVRKKGGARYDVTLDNFWKGYASYSQEERKGARPFAMNENNMSTEIAEPIDYTTHELLAGLQYADSLTQANLRAAISMFRNNISTLNVQYPLLSSASSAAAVGTASYDLYPDNNAFNLKGEFARSLPDFYKGRFTAAVSWGTNRQNDDLLSPISEAQNAQLAASGVTSLNGNNAGYAAGSALVSNWNTTAALSQPTSKQRIDNKLLDLGLSLHPVDDLSVKGSFRYYETVNKGGYTAYNPLTGQFGRGFADGNSSTALDAVVGLRPGATPGAAGSCYTPPGYAAVPGCTFGLAGAVVTGTNTPVFGEARSTKQTNYGLTADYDLTRTSSINGALEREDFKRNFREREKTWEDKLKLGYVNRALADGTFTLRTSVEADRKRGGDYRYRTFEDLGTGLPGLDWQTLVNMAGTSGYPALAAGIFNRYSYYFRKYDQADRDQNILNARLNYQAREDLDLGATVQLKNVNYPDSFYGLEKDNQDSLTLEANYQPSSGEIFYTFYSYQKGKKSMNLNSGQASVPNTACTAANLLIYGVAACSDNINGNNGGRPASSAWSSDTADRNDVFGLGIQKGLGRVRVGLDYTYSRSATDISYAYGSTAISNVATTQLAAAAIAGSALPSMTFVQHSLDFNVLVPINNKMSVRMFDHYEIGRVKDWHYDSVITGAVLSFEGNTLLLDAGAQNYHANIIGAFIQYKL
jgi:hypothetical protein